MKYVLNKNLDHKACLVLVKMICENWSDEFVGYMEGVNVVKDTISRMN